LNINGSGGQIAENPLDARPRENQLCEKGRPGGPLVRFLDGRFDDRERLPVPAKSTQSLSFQPGGFNRHQGIGAVNRVTRKYALSKIEGAGRIRYNELFGALDRLACRQALLLVSPSCRVRSVHNCAQQKSCCDAGQ